MREEFVWPWVFLIWVFWGFGGWYLFLNAAQGKTFIVIMAWGHFGVGIAAVAVIVFFISMGIRARKLERNWDYMK